MNNFVTIFVTTLLYGILCSRGQERWTVVGGIRFKQVLQKCLRRVGHQETWDSHSGVTEDSSLLGWDAVSLGEWVQTFQRVMVPPSSQVMQSNIIWGWRDNKPSKCQRPLTHCHSVTCQKTWILKVLMLQSLVLNKINACNFILIDRLFSQIWSVIAISDLAQWSAL